MSRKQEARCKGEGKLVRSEIERPKHDVADHEAKLIDREVHLREVGESREGRQNKGEEDLY